MRFASFCFPPATSSLWGAPPSLSHEHLSSDMSVSGFPYLPPNVTAPQVSHEYISQTCFLGISSLPPRLCFPFFSKISHLAQRKPAFFPVFFSVVSHGLPLAGGRLHCPAQPPLSHHKSSPSLAILSK